MFTAFLLYYTEALRLGHKHRAAGIRWQTNMWNMANDIMFVMAAVNWLSSDSPTHHWLTVLQWVGMSCWFFMELAVHLQIIKYELPGIFPSVTNKTGAIALYILVQLCFIVGYGFLHAVIGDPLVIIMITTTYVGCIAFNFGFLAQRGSRRGVSQLLVWSLVLAQFTWFFVYLPNISPDWAASPWVYALGVVCTGAALWYAVLYQRAPKFDDLIIARSVIAKVTTY